MKNKDVRSILLAVVISLSLIGGQAAPALAADLPAAEMAVGGQEEPALTTTPEAGEDTENSATDGSGNENTGSEEGAGSTDPDGGETTGTTDPEGGETTGTTDPESGETTGTTDPEGGETTGTTDPEGGETTGTTDHGVTEGENEPTPTSTPAEEGGTGAEEDSTDLMPADVTPTEEPTETPTPTPTPEAVQLATPVLRSVTNMADGVRITWGKVEGAVTYRVYKKSDSGKWTKLCDTTELRAVDTAAVSGTNCTYTVRCLKVGTTAKTSDYDRKGISILRLSQPVPVVTNTAGGVKIRWKAIDGANKYFVYRQNASGSWDTIARITDLVFIDKAAESGTNVTYTVRAFGKDAGRKTCKSSYLSTGKTILYLARPEVKVTVRGSKATVAWNAVPGATAYRVMRRANGKGSWKKAATVTETTWIDSSVKAGETWQYSVRCSAPVLSAYDTKVAKVTIMALPEMEELLNTDEGVRISWKSVKGATAYRIYRKVGKAKWKKLADVTDLTYLDKKAPAGSKICYKVRGKNAAGLGVITSAYKAVTRIVFSSNWTYASNAKIVSGMAALYQAPKAVRKGTVVCINAGHGTKGGSRVKTYCHPDGSPKVTGGTTSAGSIFAYAVSTGTDMKDGSSEASNNLKVAMLTKKALLEKGYDVLMIRESDDVQLDNVARTLIANEYADCHIAIHYDGTSSDKGAFYMSVPNITSYRNMEPVKSHWKQHNALGEAVISGLKGAGVKIYSKGSMESDLTQTSYSTVPSIDLEVGDEASPLNDTIRGKIAAGIADGLDKYFS